MNRAELGRSGWHPVHIGHLVMGLAFVGVVVVWWLVQSDLLDGDDVRWVVPLPLVFAGGAGLLATVLAGRRRAAHDSAEGDPPS